MVKGLIDFWLDLDDICCSFVVHTKALRKDGVRVAAIAISAS